MSLDKSLRSKGALVRQRNVLTRVERLKKLEDEGEWKEGETIFGLRKVRVARVKRRVKAKKKLEQAAPLAAGPESEAAPTPEE